MSLTGKNFPDTPHEKHRTLTSVASVTLLAFQLTSNAAVINLADGTAAQSSQLGGFGAGNAIDSTVNFTHTLNSDTNPTWQVLLADFAAFDVVEAFNRASGPQRLTSIAARAAFAISLSRSSIFMVM